jgi:NADPH2:quinone reductase
MTHALRIHRYGGPEELQWEAVDVAQPGPGEALLRHTAIGVNFVDVVYRRGAAPSLPHIPGREGAGIVEAIGPDVTEVAVGDRVAYAPVSGAYSERRLIAAERLVKLPDGIDDVTAAATMLQGMTVQYLIRQLHKVERGDTILVHAAAGGIGLFLCQWAAALGANVIGTVSTPAKAALAHENGCHHTILYMEEDFVARVMELTDGHGVPVVYDGVGRDTFLKSIACLGRLGQVISFGQASGPVPPFDLGLLAPKSAAVRRAGLQTFVATRPALLQVAADTFDAVLSGKVKVRVNHTYPLCEGAQANRDLEGRKTTGSIVLLP